MPVVKKPDPDSPEQQRLLRLRHSASHLLAEAVLDLFPGTQLAIGPAIAEGFYYDFDVRKNGEPVTLTEEDLKRIEKRMRELAQEDAPFERIEVSREEARRILEEIGQTKYKLELLDDIPEGEAITFYRDGNFIDLCAGPHIENKNQIRHFKLLRVSSAYWRGDETRDQLQRIYGTAFFTEEELENYLKKLELARQRTHQKLGRELELFEFFDLAGPGLVFWLPRGAIVRYELERWHAREHLKRGYQPVYTPHILRARSWQVSGHLENYRENMFGVLPLDEEAVETAHRRDGEGDEGPGFDYGLKPMNCPGHILIYQSRLRSYRDLPLRLFEFGTVYRYERSGVLSGLLRVRGFTQDDAHIFCTPDQYEEEIERVLRFTMDTLDTFDFNYFVELSTRPEKSLGTDEQWELAEGGLRKVLEKLAIPYEVHAGEGTFYGPKIDFKVLDALDREWQTATVQLDFQLPQRFGLTFIGPDGREHEPIMIHRAIFGSFERFMALLTEHYGGAFPTWLAPEQVAVVPISDEVMDYARKVWEESQARGLRVVLDTSDETLGKKIRNWTVLKVPYLFVVGRREAESGTVAVRSYFDGDLGAMPLSEALDRIEQEVAEKLSRFKE